MSLTITIFLITVFVNITINNKFNDYMADIQEKRYDRIISYFEEVYKKEGKFDENSGIELIHEAYMGSYCLTLLDENKNAIWGMDPNKIKSNLYFDHMIVKDRGVYTSKDFEVKVDGKIVGYINIGQYSSILLSEEDNSFILSINKSIVVSTVFTLVISIVISLYVSREFSSPIKEVSKMSVKLSEGNFNIQTVDKSNIEEIYNLKNSINILAEKLKHQDILRRQLVSDISHEIRTPLNILQNNLEAMIDGIFPVSTERLVKLNEEVIRFGKLLNNLDVLKQFELESIKLNLEQISLDKLILDIYKEFFIVAESKDISIDYNFKKDENYSITADRDKIRQVFINLIDNSIKFSKPNGKVQILLYKENKKIVVEIKDNGIGIDEKDLPYIFERLYRGDKSRNLIEGSGIGLTVVKNILQLHNATILVTSEYGIGSTFKVYF